MQRLIGLWGFARSGKDTVGRMLVDNFGFERASFADVLREVAVAADPYVDTGEVTGELGEDAFRRLSWFVEKYGWEKAKESADVRRYLQRLGTEGGRNILGENVWVDATFAKLDPTKNYVFTDMRFPNEKDAIVHRGGVAWRIERPGYGPVNDHASETALQYDIFHRVIWNDKDFDTLFRRVKKALEPEPPMSTDFPGQPFGRGDTITVKP